jgi:hypothetical protein
MKIGDNLYVVNKDDRTSSLDEHNFKILELKCIFKVNDFTTLKYFVARWGNSGRDRFGKFIHPFDALKEIYDKNKTIIKTWADGDIVVTTHETMEELKDDLTGGFDNIYINKDDAKDELKFLMTKHLETLKDRHLGLTETIEKLNKNLKEL